MRPGCLSNMPQPGPLVYRSLVWCGAVGYASGLLEQHPATRKHNLQLYTRPTRHLPQAATICITPELLMMGIMVPETCWAENKFCNKNHSVASSWPFISTHFRVKLKPTFLPYWYLLIFLSFLHFIQRINFCARSQCSASSPYLHLPSYKEWLTFSVYTRVNKNPSAWDFLSPKPEVTCGTVAIIIRVVLLSPYLRIRAASLFSIHYNQSHRVYINRRRQYICLIWN